METRKQLYRIYEMLVALKMHAAGRLYAVSVSSNFNLEYSFLNSSKDFIK